MASVTRQLVADQRSSQRYQVTVELEYKVILNGSSSTGTGRAVDLSSGGMRFAAATPLPKGAPIELAIAWPGRLSRSLGLRLHVVGKVIRIEDGLAAVIFDRHDFYAA